MFIEDIHKDVELSDVAKLFFGLENAPHISLEINGDFFVVKINDKVYSFDYSSPLYNAVPAEHKTGRLGKIAVYDALKAHTGREMLWGALTGVRPTKLFYELLNNGFSHAQATELMRDIYRVDYSRACILRRIEYAQRGKLKFPDEYINLYVDIPYCTSRCSYCSFPSFPIAKNIAQSQEYVMLLRKEIRQAKRLLEEYGKKILSVYVGGGTPTALTDDCFDTLLSAIGDFDGEYTVEAGRPDTITRSKAEILKTHRVNRVCVNPQTLCDKTLKLLSRNHTAGEFLAAYDIVRDYGFDINCDLITGLPEETLDDFIYSYNKIIELEPANITVHSLSKKNGAAIRYDIGENAAAVQMTEYALENLGKYRPYYLYRQKRQACNLENIGLSLVGKECINNITVMEESVGVIGCGAGAISKYVGNGEISRFANMRDVGLYIDRFERKSNEKTEFFKNKFRSER